MSLSIFYKGNLKDNAVEDFYSTVASVAQKHQWHVERIDKGIVVNVPDFEPVMFRFNNGSVDTWTKYFGQTKEQLTELFDMLWAIKPYFKRLVVSDDEGWWENYAAKQKKENFPPFRELKEIELAEYKRGFDLPEGQTAVLEKYQPLFPMGNTPDILMKMIRKDMSRNLVTPISKENLLTDIDERIILFGPPNEPISEMREKAQFEAIVENWILRKLADKNGNCYGETYINKTKGWPNWANFSWLMREMLYSSFGGSIGSKHSKLQRFVEKVISDGNTLEDDITFLRLIYSSLEYLGIYRPDNLIERTQ